LFTRRIPNPPPVHCPIVTTRLALLVAPTDPLVSNAPARLEALGWLRNQLSRRGFQIAIVGGGVEPLADLERVAGNVEPGASVVVHVSGRLSSADTIALNKTTTFALPTFAELLGTRSPGYLSMILDLVQEEDSGETAADLLADTVRSLGGAEHGYSLLASVRWPGDGSERIAFTRFTMPPADDGGPPSGESLLSTMHDRAAEADGDGGAQRFVFVQGAADATIDGQIAQATEARDWTRVVELRLDRVETLGTPAQRAEELAGIARILQFELRDADGAVDILEKARELDPKRASVLEALRNAYEASGRAAPIDPAEYAKAFATHKRAGQSDAALLDAMLLVEVGSATPEQQSVVEQARSAGPVQVLKPLDATAWELLRAPGYDGGLASLFAAVHDDAVAARVERMGRKRPSPGTRLDAESTVSAVRTLHWAARVLGVTCPDLYAGTADDAEALAHVLGERPSIALAPRVLSGTSTKQLAFLAGRALSWYRPEYHVMLHYPTLDELRELAGARLGALGGEDGLVHWIRSAELTAARAGLLLCGELKIAVAGVGSQPAAAGRPTAERVASDLIAFCASRAHATLRAQFLKLG
jgi:hypothetical protein